MSKSDIEKPQYIFKLLREESVDEDSFEDNTHERIAESILKLITTEERGISIGLEGPWGSGKSTIISILRRKLKETDPSILLIQFDAWAHEGDPLRRIFLESLIEEITFYVDPNVRNELGDLKEKIAHRQKITKIEATRSTTGLGKLLSIALLLVPIGVAFLSSINYSEMSSGTSNWVLWLGLGLSASPFYVIIGNLIRILFNKKLRDKGILNSKNWAFLEDKADQKVTQEVSEEDERSSIEFEQYFEQIIDIVFKNSNIKKLVLVMDNLDRVDVHDALKIWSTLQIFLSQRTQVWNKKEWFDKIWIIIPYDSEGLSRLWNSNTEGSERSLSKPFFDKCFQLRIDVPKPVFSGWEKFARDKINEALKGYSDNEREELIRILRMTRKDLTDIPTPREIKNYINQVGFLTSQWDHIVSISSIAYYVCWRVLANESVENIKKKLIKRELTNLTHKDLLPEKCIEELAGLVFGVPPDRGVQLLLGPKIYSALRNGDSRSLEELQKTHGEGFWSVFNFHIERHMDSIHTLNAAKAIYDSIWKSDTQKCTEFVNKVTKINLDAVQKEIEWSEEEIDKYICLIKICQSEGAFIKSIYRNLINCFRNSLNKDKEVEWGVVVKGLSKVINTICNIGISIQQETIEKLSLPYLIPLSQASSALGCEIYKWIAPPKNVVGAIRQSIAPGRPVQEGLSEVVEYSIDAGIKNGWDTVLTQCWKYIKQGNYSDQSDEIFKTINAITFKLYDREEINKIASSIVNSGQYHDLFWRRRRQNLLYAALLCGYVFNGNLRSKTIPSVGNSTAGFNEIKKFWASSSSDNADQVLREIKKYNLWAFIWELATDEGNKLVKDIIITALGDEDAVELFRVKNVLVKLKNFSNFFENPVDEEERIIKLIGKFIKYAGLKNEIIKTDSIDLFEYDYELYLIVKKTKDRKVIIKLANELKNITKEAWFKAFKKDIYLTSLALEVKNKLNNFSLENNYMDALIEFVESQNEQSSYTDRQRNHWDELISLMAKSFQEHYKSKITKYLCDNLETAPMETFNLNKEYFIYSEILNERKIIQDAIDTFVKEKNIKRLQLINEILSKGEFTPEEYFPDVMKQPLQELYSEQGSENNKAVIKFLADKLSIELLEDDSEENEKNS